MFDLESEIKAWRQNLEHQKVGDGEILDELESHLREEFDRLRAGGLSDPERFRLSAARVGNICELKREYRKLRWKRFWNFHKTPTAVKFVAACFLFKGVDLILSDLRFVFYMPLSHAILPVVYALLPVIVGIGLLRDRRRWRKIAFICTALETFYAVQGSFLLWHVFLNPPTPPPGQFAASGALFMGVDFPISIVMSTDLISVALLVWGCCVLTKPSVRNFFRPAGSSQIST